MLSVINRVMAGAAWLDARTDLGTWEAAIYPETLKMSDPCNCICGSIFGKEGDVRGTDETGFQRVFVMLLAEGLHPMDLGFMSNGTAGDYKELKRAWLKLVEERLGKDEDE